MGRTEPPAGDGPQQWEVPEPVNRVEAALVRSTDVLPAGRPSNLVVLVTTAARGSALWLLVAAGLALRAGVCRRAAAHGMVAVAVASAMSHLAGKAVVRRRRPDIPPPAREALPVVPRSSSFPSAHTASAVAFSAALALEHRPLGAAVAPVAALVAYSRVRTRVHWPTDVLSGALFGAAAAWLGRWLWHGYAALRRNGLSFVTP